jgi:hypothetical protein
MIRPPFEYKNEKLKLIYVLPDQFRLANIIRDVRSAGKRWQAEC